MEYQSIPQLFKACAEADPSMVAYRFKSDGAWKDVTWADAQQTVYRAAKALMSLGVERDTKVCILGQTRLEWVLGDFAIGHAGGVTVGIYPSNLPADCQYIINHSDAQLIFVENAEQLDKILEVRENLTDLREIVIWDGAGDAANNVLSWDEFLARGDGVPDEQLVERAATLTPDDLASLVYTSGTTGVPKGVMISHGNLLFTAESASGRIYGEPGFDTLLFLPLAHVFARLIVYCCLKKRVTVNFAEGITEVAPNLREVRPHFIASVPRIYEKVYDKITSGVEQAGGVKKKLFDWALGVGTEVSQLKQKKQSVPALLALKYGLAEKLVFKKIQGAMGGRMIFAISGAAPLNRQIAEFFHACGVLILEGLGMTENTSFSNCNKIDDNKFGTVGTCGPGIEMKLAPDGEVLFRGGNNMKGYYKNPEATAETIDADGWLYTGDIGEIDDDGFLRITDRKKDLIITAGGKNIAPQRIERIVRTSHYVAQVVAYGDKRKFISALITLEPEAIEKWAGENGLGDKSLAELASDPKVNALIQSEVEGRNGQLASFESIKKFAILPRDFTIEDGELTPTLKLKRKVIYDRYAAELDALYA